jgi:hypothetical protein
LKIKDDMTVEHIELIIEFSVILLAPIIHNYYLWKVKKVDASVIQQNIKIFSFFYVLIAIGVALLLTTPKVHANDSHCYSIQNADSKNTCLAFAKRQDSYCYSVQESDSKNRCLALVKNQDSYCYSVQNADMKNHCLALVKRQDSHCYSVRESDDKNLCLAQLKSQDSYCYSIRSNDTKNQCLSYVK